ncbi:MAG: glycosyltransferase family 2 protein [Candidatus Magasanikbacteria bacterium]|nr:glycosyltransferase family 2 protein [Candidatus Magasanikbacteria bacterium]
MIIAIVPAYNEEKNIGSVVQDLFGVVDKVVVVDDGSKDNTTETAQKAGATVLSHFINRGQGAALQTGHDFAKKIGAEFVVHFDGDAQFAAGDILTALEKIKKYNADILFGSRFLEKKSKIPFAKKYVVLPLARVVSIFFGSVKLSDAHNGFRILNRNALDKIVITQDRMAHATQIPALVKKHKLTFVEYPVNVIYREYGQNFFSGFKIVEDLFFGKFLNK